MAKSLNDNILIHFLTNENNTYKEIAKKYDVSIWQVKKIVEAYFKEKNCKHEFYEIDSWTGLKQCKFCDKLKS
jgi:Mor family transcriptional regulator